MDCPNCGKDVDNLAKHNHQFHEALEIYATERSKSEIQKEIKDLQEYINVASFENPLNMGDSNDKLSALQVEWTNATEEYKKEEDEEPWKPQEAKWEMEGEEGGQGSGPQSSSLPEQAGRDPALHYDPHEKEQDPLQTDPSLSQLKDSEFEEDRDVKTTEDPDVMIRANPDYNPKPAMETDDEQKEEKDKTEEYNAENPNIGAHGDIGESPSFQQAWSEEETDDYEVDVDEYISTGEPVQKIPEDKRAEEIDYHEDKPEMTQKEWDEDLAGLKDEYATEEDKENDDNLVIDNDEDLFALHKGIMDKPVEEAYAKEDDYRLQQLLDEYFNNSGGGSPNTTGTRDGAIQYLINKGIADTEARWFVQDNFNAYDWIGQDETSYIAGSDVPISGFYESKATEDEPEEEKPYYDQAEIERELSKHRKDYSDYKEGEEACQVCGGDHSPATHGEDKDEANEDEDDLPWEEEEKDEATEDETETSDDGTDINTPMTPDVDDTDTDAVATFTMESWDGRVPFNTKVEAFEALGISQGDSLKLAELNWRELSIEVRGSLNEFADNEKEEKRIDSQDAFNDEGDGVGSQPDTQIEDLDSIDYNIIDDNTVAREKYQCEHCNSEFKSNEALMIHFNDLHVPAREFLLDVPNSCNFCGKEIPSDISMGEHLAYDHGISLDTKLENGMVTDGAESELDGLKKKTKSNEVRTTKTWKPHVYKATEAVSYEAEDDIDLNSPEGKDTINDLNKPYDVVPKLKEPWEIEREGDPNVGEEDFKEQEHPREDSGKFTSGGGGGSKEPENKHTKSTVKDIIKSIKGGSKDWHDWGRNEKTEDAYAEIERRNKEIPTPTMKGGGKIFRDDPDAVGKMEQKVKFWEERQDYWKKITKFPSRDYQNRNQLGDAKWYELSNIGANLRDAKKKLDGIKAQQGRGTQLVRKSTYPSGKKRFYYSEEPKVEEALSQQDQETLDLLKSGRIEGVHDPQREDKIKELEANEVDERWECLDCDQKFDDAGKHQDETGHHNIIKYHGEAKLSDVIDKVNKDNEPEGGWDEDDQVNEASHWDEIEKEEGKMDGGQRLDWIDNRMKQLNKQDPRTYDEWKADQGESLANEEVEYTGGDTCATCGTPFEDRGECKKCNDESIANEDEDWELKNDDDFSEANEKGETYIFFWNHSDLGSSGRNTLLNNSGLSSEWQNTDWGELPLDIQEGLKPTMNQMFRETGKETMNDYGGEAGMEPMEGDDKIWEEDDPNIHHDESFVAEDDPDFENDPDYQGFVDGNKKESSQYTQDGIAQAMADPDWDKLDEVITKKGV